MVLQITWLHFILGSDRKFRVTADSCHTHRHTHIITQLSKHSCVFTEEEHTRLYLPFETGVKPTWDFRTGEDDAVHLYGLLCSGEVISVGEIRAWAKMSPRETADCNKCHK